MIGGAFLAGVAGRVLASAITEMGKWKERADDKIAGAMIARGDISRDEAAELRKDLNVYAKQKTFADAVRASRKRVR